MDNQEPFPNEPLGDLIYQKFGNHRALAKAAHVPIATVERALRGLPISNKHADAIERALGTAVYIDRMEK